MTENSPAMAISMTGQVVLITGGTRGIGRAIAGAFLRAGATVAICARSAPDEPISAAGRTAGFHACNVKDATACQQLIATVAGAHGRLDVLVNNAGGSPAVSAATVSPRFSESIIALNLLAPLYLSQAAYQQMEHQPGGGAIINIASISGRRPSPGTAAYGAAKAGLLSLTTSLAQEWGPKVRVNAIVAGLIETETANDTYGSDEAQDAIARSIPMRRMGRGTDVADAVLFLASPLAGFVSGAALEVHGGGEQPPFLEVIRRLSPRPD